MSQKQQKKLRRMSKDISSEFNIPEKRIRKIAKDAYSNIRKSGNKGKL